MVRFVLTSLAAPRRAGTKGGPYTSLADADWASGVVLFGFKKQQHTMTDPAIKRTRTPATAPTITPTFELELLLGEGVLVGGEGAGGCTVWTCVAAAFVIVQVGSEARVNCVLIFDGIKRIFFVESACVRPLSCSIEAVTVEADTKSLLRVCRTDSVMRHLWHKMGEALELPQTPQSDNAANTDTILSFFVLISEADNGREIETDTV
jgi:hypothetical protein